MHIVNSMAANFGKYDLDVSAVGMRSISETDINVKIVCERRCDEGVRFFKDNVCGTIRTIDGGGQESD